MNYKFRNPISSTIATLLLITSTIINVHAQSLTDSLETYLNDQMKQLKIPGMQIAIIRHGKVILSKSYGTANVEDSIPVTGQTLFPVHSITKAFVGIAAMQLVEQGKLDLSAPVSRYLDGLPETWQQITVRQLLTHTSGLPDCWDSNDRMLDYDDDIAWAKVLATSVRFAPGEKFQYVQTNYILIGKIIDKLSGMPFTRFIQEHQFNVAGMPHSNFSDSRDVTAHIAGNYWYLRNVHDGREPSANLQVYLREWPPYLRTAVGLNTSAEELAKWIMAIQEGKLLNKASLKTLWTPGVLNDGSHQSFSPLLNGYALGWPIAIRPEHPAIATIGGGKAALFMYPEDDLTVIVVTNLIFAAPESFIDEIAGFYIPDMRASNGFGMSPVLKQFRAQLLKNGFEHAIELAEKEKRKNPQYQLPENDLNNWGYAMLLEGKKKDALEILRLTAKLYPVSWNAYDSLAEAYEDLGERELAIKNYRHSLDLNPKNTNAVEHLKKLSVNHQ
jgi:CubicO group peptidase (beta-lactamase class C family)